MSKSHGKSHLGIVSGATKQEIIDKLNKAATNRENGILKRIASRLLWLLSWCTLMPISFVLDILMKINPWYTPAAINDPQVQANTSGVARNSQAIIEQRAETAQLKSTVSADNRRRAAQQRSEVETNEEALEDAQDGVSFVSTSQAITSGSSP